MQSFRMSIVSQSLTYVSYHIYTSLLVFNCIESNELSYLSNERNICLYYLSINLIYS